MTATVAICLECGWLGDNSDLLPDSEHSCGKDECPECGATNCIACCLTARTAVAKLARRGLR
jgi:hypothetical protein